MPANSRFASLKDLVAFAKVNPGKLNVGSIAVGSTQHLAAKLFETVAGVDTLVLPYRGSPAVMTALRTGEIDLAFEIVVPMLPQVQAGVVRALTVSSGARNPALPDAPTVAQAGVAGYDVASWNAIAAPVGTPREVVALLNRAVRDAVASPAVEDKLGKLGMRLGAGSPAELQSLRAARSSVGARSSRRQRSTPSKSLAKSGAGQGEAVQNARSFTGEAQTMRALLSLAALLIVLFLVMKLSGTQLQALGPTANTKPGAAAGTASTASTAAERSADQVVRAMEQGAAARAADAASR